MSVIHFLARLAYPLNSVRRVLRGPLRGFRFVVTPGFGVYYAIGSDALHTNVLTALVKSGSRVFDVGANRGHVSLLLANAAGPDGQVLAFEPVEELCRDLNRNLELNRVRNVTVCNTALGETDGEIQFLYSSHASTQGKFADAEKGLVVQGATPIRVQQAPLDSYARQHGFPDFVKIDVEGAAGYVLRGASETIARKTAVFFIELHGPEEQQAVQTLLVEQGYEASDGEGRPVNDATISWHSPLILRPVRVITGR